MKNRFTLLIAFCLMCFAASAQLVDVITGIDSPWSLELDGNDLYIGLDGAGIIKIDKTQPNPVPVDVITGIGLQGGLYLDGNDLYIGENSNNKVIKLDISQATPTPMDVLTVQEPNVILKSGNYLYVGTESSGIHKFDLTDLSNVVTYPVNGAVGGLALKGDVLYYSRFQGGVYQIDESQPNPTSTQLIDLTQPFGLTLNGNFLYVATQTSVVKIDLGQTMPQADVVVSGLNSSRLTTFDGLDLYISEFGGNKVSKLAIATPEFSTLPTLCANRVYADLGGASPTGGTYSGPGVTDNGNGETFSFDPATAGGSGAYAITYTTVNGATVTTTLTVVAPPNVTFTPPASVTIDAGIQTLNGMPAGGTYAGPGVSGNSFDPQVAGIGTHTISYTYTDANGCEGMASATITVTQNLPPDNACAGANDISNLFGGPLNEPQTSGIWDNTNYTSDGDPVNDLSGCFFDDDPLQQTIWFTFTGNGDTYQIRSVQCNASNYNDDTQVAIFSGDCSDLSFVTCNDDEDSNNEIYNFYVELPTEDGVAYYMLVDGWNSQAGEFCIEVTNLSPNAVTEISATDIEVFPNPTRGEMQLRNVQADRVEVFDKVGRLLLSAAHPGNYIDISEMPVGVYILKIIEGDQVFSARVVKE